MPEFRSVLVHAIVLRHSDWGEADRLVSIFTRERGKVRAVVKGARKITSRKAGHLEPFTHVKLQLARGRSDLLIVTQADTIDAFLSLRDSLELAGNASYIVEIIDRFVYEEEGPNPTLFRVLLDPLLRDAHAGFSRLPPAAPGMHQLRARDQSRGPVLLLCGGRSGLSPLREWASQPGTHLCERPEVSAAFPAQQLCRRTQGAPF